MKRRYYKTPRDVNSMDKFYIICLLGHFFNKNEQAIIRKALDQNKGTYSEILANLTKDEANGLQSKITKYFIGHGDIKKVSKLSDMYMLQEAISWLNLGDIHKFAIAFMISSKLSNRSFCRAIILMSVSIISLIYYSLVLYNIYY